MNGTRFPDIRVSREYKGGTITSIHSDAGGEVLQVTSNNPRQVITVPLSTVEKTIEELNLRVNAERTRVAR